MATCAEKIRRRTFGFWKKIICRAPLLSPERMLMGRPCLIWDDNPYTPQGRLPNYTRTMEKYLTERALQLYYYTEILHKPVDFDHKALLKQMLNFGTTTADRASQEHWIHTMRFSPEKWDWIVKYGQFEPTPATMTEQEKRQKRQNTFAPEVPKNWIRQNGGIAILRNRMRNLA